MKRVYLDQNHWSYLSLALGGQPRTQAEAEAARVIARSVANQEASFPLSTAHVFETWKLIGADKRLAIARTMIEVSRHAAIAPPQQLVPAELALALHRRFDTAVSPPEVQAFGRGLAHLSGGLFSELDPELVAYVRAEHPEFDDAEVTDWIEARLIAGPEQDLPVGELTPPPMQSAEGFAAGQTELQERFKQQNTNEPERRRAVAASMMRDITEPLTAALRQTGVTVDQFTALERKELIALMLDLPSRVALLELMTRQHADLGTKWVANDLNDLVYLSAAIGYCDIVVTERKWSAIINSTDVPARTGTVVLAKLAELPAALASDGGSS